MAMAHVEWKREFETGIALVDEQHRNLVEIINRFDDAIHKGKGSKHANEILDQLIGYTQEHFASEERLMAEVDYPQLKLHQSQHRQLLQKVERFQFDFNAAGRRITSELHEFLGYWLVTHILRDDCAFGVSFTQATPQTQAAAPATGDADGR